MIQTVVERPNLPRPPSRLERPCPALPLLPERDLTQEETESALDDTTVMYAECAALNRETHTFYRKRDAALMRKP